MSLGLDLNIQSMMQNSIVWEAYASQDGHGDASFAAPVTLPCWIEAAGMSTGGIVAVRAPHADTYDAEIEIFFDGNDSRVQAFTMSDRFTVNSETAAAKTAQPVRINVFRGPTNEHWITVVSL
jgi:hypothetical protein